MTLSADWSFEEALENINDQYPPWGRVRPQLRNRQLESWGQLVGRTRALASFASAVEKNGSLTVLGKTYSITVNTLRQLKEFFERLPDDYLDRERRIIESLQKIGRESRNIDAKQELVLRELGEKAEFVKDIVAMANNAEPSFIVIGLKDGTFTPIGKIVQSYSQNDINQILSDKIDPPVVVDYREVEIDGSEYGFIEVHGVNPPYIVARDVVHGSTDRKKARVYKGTMFVRHGDRTEGISRTELEEIFKNRE
jgi:Putative DNA-binding domain